MAGAGKDDIVVEFVSAKLMKFRIQLDGKSNVDSFVIGYAPILHASVRDDRRKKMREDTSTC